MKKEKEVKKIEIATTTTTDERREHLRKSATIARAVFGFDAPPEAVFGASEALATLEDPDLAETALRAGAAKAEEIRRALDVAETSVEDALEVCRILYSDDEGEARLAEAAREVPEIFGPSARTVAAAVGVYYEIYGEDEE